MRDVTLIPALTDNYIYLLHDSASGEAIVVDPSVAAPVKEVLAQRGARLSCILCTHHHADHIGGSQELRDQTGCEVVGYDGDAHRIPAITRRVKEGERLRFGDQEIEVLFIPGHTLGHVAYYFTQDRLLFCGDTLFLMGCGRLFEGTAGQMHASLAKLAALPDDTRVYCGHEYTEANGRFALSVEPGNAALQARMKRVEALRAAGTPTLPGTMGEEKATNPFLRTGSAEIQETLGLRGKTEAEIFAALRKAKDFF